MSVAATVAGVARACALRMGLRDDGPDEIAQETCVRWLAGAAGRVADADARRWAWATARCLVLSRGRDARRRARWLGTPVPADDDVPGRARDVERAVDGARALAAMDAATRAALVARWVDGPRPRKAHVRLAPPDVAALRAARAAGATLAQLARRFGVGRATAHRLCGAGSAPGARPRKAHVRLGAAAVAALRAERLTGATLAALARRYDVNVTTVRNLTRWGAP